jgi:hypothetical protein
LVTKASRSVKRDFLHTLTADDTRVIKLRLGLSPDRFWRAAKRKEFLNLPMPPLQLTLFD